MTKIPEERNRVADAIEQLAAAITMSPINFDDLETALKKVEEKIVAVFGN